MIPGESNSAYSISPSTTILTAALCKKKKKAKKQTTNKQKQTSRIYTKEAYATFLCSAQKTYQKSQGKYHVRGWVKTTIKQQQQQQLNHQINGYYWIDKKFDKC